MAVEPLYNASKYTLLSRVRIQDADDEATLALVDQAITEVRLGFYRRITKERAITIAGYTLVDNPTSDEEILIAKAANTEALWVTWLLAQRLPHLFIDNRASVGDQWNDEQLTRDTLPSEYLKSLKTLIDEGLSDLEEPVNADSGPVKSDSIGPDESATPYARGTFLGLYPDGSKGVFYGGYGI